MLISRELGPCKGPVVDGVMLLNRIPLVKLGAGRRNGGDAGEPSRIYMQTGALSYGNQTAPFGYNQTSGIRAWLSTGIGAFPQQLFPGYCMIRSQYSRVAGLLVTSLLMIAAGACGGSSGGGQIAFVSDVDGDQEVFLLDPDTGEATPLTDNRSEDFGPRWSPGGKVLAYITDQAGNLDINLADQQADTLSRLTHSDDDDQAPLWSPDGERMAFISERDGNPEVYLMQSDGNIQTRITSNATNEDLGDWSPDGIWLVFARLDEETGDDSNEGLWLRNPDGVNLVHLTKGHDSAPAWSPNGKDIAFVRTDGQNADIYIVSRLNDGTWQEVTELTRLTQQEAGDLAPAWSPDGKTLAFVTHRDGNAEIYTMRGDGSKQRRLTNNGADDLAPVWSPNGKRMAFVSLLYGEGEIFVMDSDGGGQRRLTTNDANDHSPDW